MTWACATHHRALPLRRLDDDALVPLLGDFEHARRLARPGIALRRNKQLLGGHLASFGVLAALDHHESDRRFSFWVSGGDISSATFYVALASSLQIFLLARHLG
jgi:hypothetical protein